MGESVQRAGIVPDFDAVRQQNLVLGVADDLCCSEESDREDAWHQDDCAWSGPRS